MALKSDDVNYLIYRYLKESGFLHSSYIFQFESQISRHDREQPNVEPGTLLHVLQKGLQYMDVEAHLNEDGTARACTSPFTLVGRHVCSTQTDDAARQHGGHTLVHDTARGERIVHGAHASDDDTDGGVPDAKKPHRSRRARLVEDALVLRGHTAAVFLCAWNPVDAQVLATGGGDSTARIWDTGRVKSDGGATCTVLRHGSDRVDVTSMAWNAQGTQLATAAFDGQVRVWTGGSARQLAGRRAPVVALRWNRRGSVVAGACLDGTVVLWDAATGTVRQELVGHAGAVLDVDWQDNTTLASCSADRTVRVWRVGESAPVLTLSGHRGDVNSVRWHPAGKLLASASDDGTVKVWTLGAADAMQDFVGHAQQVYVVRWMPRADKAVVATASFDGTVRVWDVHSGACLRVLAAHTEAVHCIAFSADCKHLASGSFDRRVRVWGIKDGSLVRTFAADDGVHDVQWAQGAKGRVAAAIANGTVAVFDPLP